VNNACAVFKKQLNTGNVYCPLYVRPQLDFAGPLCVSFFLSTVILQYSYLDHKRVIVRLNTPTFVIFFLFLPLVLWFTDGLTESK
jgi:hypothetical protein